MSTIPSVLAPVINSFTPTKNYPSFSSLINEGYVVTTLPTGNATYTPAQIIGGLIVHPVTGASTGTLPTATLLIPAIQGAAVGSGIRVIFDNGAGTATLTIAVGAGGTLKAASGAIATLDVREFLIIVTNLGDVNAVGATYDCYSLGAASAE